MLKKKGLFLLVLSILLLGGFFNSTTVSARYIVRNTSKSVTTVKVTSVSLNKTKCNITVGGTYTLLATVNPTKAKNKAVKWTSSNPRIAKVDAKGKVTAVSAGAATITVTTVDGNKKATCSVTINIPIIKATSVSLNKIVDSLTVGEKDTLIATVNPIKAINKAVTWSSSNTTIATVDNAGNVTAVSAGTVTITATTEDGSKTSNCNVNVDNKKGYVHNPDDLITDLNVRSEPNLNGIIQGCLYNYDKVEILDTILDAKTGEWYKIIYKGGFAYVSSAYIQRYTSPPDNVVNVARNITKQFEGGTSNQIAGNFDGQGLSLGYFQWCIGQGTLQPLLNRMDREYNAEMKNIFGTSYDIIHNMIHDSLENQRKWANSINDSTNKIIDPWYSQFAILCNNEDFINIEADAEIYTVRQAMIICNDYNLKTVRGFSLAFDIAVQNGSISIEAKRIIDTALGQTLNMSEKKLLEVIANAVADSSGDNSEDIRSRKMAIVNGQGTVHGSMLYLDGLSDNCWR